MSKTTTWFHSQDNLVTVLIINEIIKLKALWNLKLKQAAVSLPFILSAAAVDEG